MASFSTGVFTPDRLIAGEEEILSRKVTILSGQNLVRGAVLGKITASGKYVLSLSAAADGSQTPDAVLAMDTDASAADKEAMAYFTGRFNESALTLGASHTAASIREGACARRASISSRCSPPERKETEPTCLICFPPTY